MAEPDYRGRAAAGITALQRWYRPRTGLWAGTAFQVHGRGIHIV